MFRPPWAQLLIAGPKSSLTRGGNHGRSNLCNQAVYTRSSWNSQYLHLYTALVYLIIFPIISGTPLLPFQMTKLLVIREVYLWTNARFCNWRYMEACTKFPIPIVTASLTQLQHPYWFIAQWYFQFFEMDCRRKVDLLVKFFCRNKHNQSKYGYQFCGMPRIGCD